MANTPSNLPSPPPPLPLLPHQIFTLQRNPIFYVDAGALIDTLRPPPLPADLPFDLDDLFRPHSATLPRESFENRLNAGAAAYAPDVVALPVQSGAGSMSAAEGDGKDVSDDDEFYPPAAERDSGLPEEVIERFLETAAAPPAAEGDHETCAVCLDDLYGEVRTVGVLGCRHRFHGECIGKWLRKKNDCPLCRATAVQML